MKSSKMKDGTMENPEFERLFKKAVADLNKPVESMVSRASCCLMLGSEYETQFAGASVGMVLLVHSLDTLKIASGMLATENLDVARAVIKASSFLDETLRL